MTTGVHVPVLLLVDSTTRFNISHRPFASARADIFPCGYWALDGTAQTLAGAAITGDSRYWWVADDATHFVHDTLGGIPKGRCFPFAIPAVSSSLKAFFYVEYNGSARPVESGITNVWINPTTGDIGGDPRRIQKVLEWNYGFGYGHVGGLSEASTAAALEARRSAEGATPLWVVVETTLEWVSDRVATGPASSGIANWLGPYAEAETVYDASSYSDALAYIATNY